ncbi:Daunorubicin/doxorubicin resistance ATP-binding protein DrrA [Rubripirellula lacrimiformis]|uniref:Daunorubicin/doxorubicin resistance ATP-binding protein DrrA n=1 Tax=Rubripirellula lacrimiformis TaxID=1930273 RepID=A0A517N5U5_9BACT|nr:ATP-binding cassette domain-containing protein [Rubripirellula lacrimiformis]QDT02493.1 Daunorubicin/doxorubicin resistance ATP-binding protein DrrA [Rubripirellula lacrimiformis]
MSVCIAESLHHSYGDHVALSGLDLSVDAGQVVALLGPNGSGKTTLFRLLCTLLPIQQGSVTIGGFDAKTSPLAVRGQIGIVFQSPSLDKKLTVDENIACQAALYGIRGDELNRRRDELLDLLDLKDRRSDYCESLSGGLKRRVELAKGMLHQPQLLLLDEPSTGLDPSARLSLWSAIRRMADGGMAVLMTTHLLEEADKADRVIIMADGRKIAEGSPHTLRSEMGGGLVTIQAADAEAVQATLRDDLGLDVQRLDHQLRLQSDAPEDLVPRLIAALGDRAESITIGRPSLEDVFVAKTGQAFDVV